VCLPLLIFPCTMKSRSSLLALAHLGGPRKRAVNSCGLTDLFICSSGTVSYHLDWFSRFCTACSRVSLYFTMSNHFSPSKLPLHMGESVPPSYVCFLRPTRVHNPNSISIDSAIFARLTADSPYTLQWATSPSPLKIFPLHGRSGSPSNTWFLGPTRVYNPNGVSVSSAIFAALTIVTERTTDHTIPL